MVVSSLQVWHGVAVVQRYDWDWWRTQLQLQQPHQRLFSDEDKTLQKKSPNVLVVAFLDLNFNILKMELPQRQVRAERKYLLDRHSKMEKFDYDTEAWKLLYSWVPPTLNLTIENLTIYCCNTWGESKPSLICHSLSHPWLPNLHITQTLDSYHDYDMVIRPYTAAPLR